MFPDHPPEVIHRAGQRALGGDVLSTVVETLQHNNTLITSTLVSTSSMKAGGHITINTPNVSLVTELHKQSLSFLLQTKSDH